MPRPILSLLVLVSVVSVAAAQSTDPKVMEAQRLKRLNALVNPESRKQVVAVGQRVPDFRHAAGLFGVEFLKDEGAVIHSLNTVVIDRQGRLAANLEGNGFTAAELIDLVKSILNRP